MILSLKKKLNLTKEQEQEQVADSILDRFGIGRVLAIGYVKDAKTGKSAAIVPCVQTGETLRFETDRLQPQDEIASLIPHQLSQLVTTKQEGAFCNQEDVNSIDALFDLVNVVED